MGFRPNRTVAPNVAIITLDQVKKTLNILHVDDDDKINALILAAETHLDAYSGVIGRCLINQTWTQDFSCFSRGMVLPFPDVSSVSFTYLDGDGVQQDLMETLKIVEGESRSIVTFSDQVSFPAVQSGVATPITATLIAGYGAVADDVPAPIREAAKMLVAYWYEPEMHEEKQLLEIVDMMISPFRKVGV